MKESASAAVEATHWYLPISSVVAVVVAVLDTEVVADDERVLVAELEAEVARLVLADDDAVDDADDVAVDDCDVLGEVTSQSKNRPCTMSLTKLFICSSASSQDAEELTT